MKNFGNAHLVDRGVTNWPVTTVRLVRHHWLGIGFAAYGDRHVGIYSSRDNWRTCFCFLLMFFLKFFSRHCLRPIAVFLFVHWQILGFVKKGPTGEAAMLRIGRPRTGVSYWGGAESPFPPARRSGSAVSSLSGTKRFSVIRSRHSTIKTRSSM